VKSKPDAVFLDRDGDGKLTEAGVHERIRRRRLVQ